MNTAHWQGKVAVVTGGSAGLGKSIALAFGNRGAHVVIVARGQERLDQAAAELAAAGCHVRAIAADAASEHDMQRVMEEVRAHWDRLDVLVNNAGKSTRQRVLETTPADFHALLEANFISAVTCTRAAIDLLRASRGHLVNIGSLAAKVGPRFMGAYPASKFALAAYSQQLRLELAEDGVHVLLVCPGPIRRVEVRNYAGPESGLPPEALKPGAGARAKAIDPDDLARRIVRACEKRKLELIVPAKARFLFVLQQVAPRLGDWLLRKMTA